MTQTTPNYPQTRHGFTLTELAIVLAIMGTILGAIWGAVSSTQKARKLSRAEQQITSTLLALTTNLNQNIGYFTPYPWGGADLTSVAINAGFFPLEMISTCWGNPCALSPWGGRVLLKLESTNTGSGGWFDDIDYRILATPTDTCLKLGILYKTKLLGFGNFSSGGTASPIWGTSLRTATTAQLQAACINSDINGLELRFWYPLRQ
jgi:prepilin-type N-terminal cleavage/methylation domain-containing protein